MNKFTYPISFSESELAMVSLPKTIYEAKSIRQTAYKYSGEYFIIARENGDNINVTFESKDKKVISETTIKEICNDFIDQQIRIDTEKEFGHIRDLIVEEAFKPVNR